jgi:hypothetical protein
MNFMSRAQGMMFQKMSYENTHSLDPFVGSLDLEFKVTRQTFMKGKFPFKMHYYNSNWLHCIEFISVLL